MYLFYCLIFVLDTPYGRSVQHSHEFWSHEVRTGSERIVGGRTASTLIPYQVTLQTEDVDGWLHFCSGSIIGKHHVLTAAHCTNDLFRPEMRVLAGTLNRHDGDLHYVIAVHQHPRYCRCHGHPLRHDLAVLQVYPPFDTSKPTVQPISIGDQYVRGNERVTVSGWGLMQQETSQESLPNVLQVLQQFTVAHEKCNAIWSKASRYNRTAPFISKAYELCAHKPMGICAADSGGPLVLRRGKRDILVGVVSTGSSLCGHKAPDIYMRLSSELPFIRAAMQKIY